MKVTCVRQFLFLTTALFVIVAAGGKPISVHTVQREENYLSPSPIRSKRNDPPPQDPPPQDPPPQDPPPQNPPPQNPPPQNPPPGGSGANGQKKKGRTTGWGYEKTLPKCSGPRPQTGKWVPSKDFPVGKKKKCNRAINKREKSK